MEFGALPKNLLIANDWLWRMAKELTVREMASMGGRARVKAHSRAEIRRWGKRRSPWAEAINVAGWIGILLPPIWMLALIAAFIKPRSGEGAPIAISEDRDGGTGGDHHGDFPAHCRHGNRNARISFQSDVAGHGGITAMMVAILVIGYVLILRWLDQKNREKDRLKAGAAMPPGPADYATIQKALAQVSDRLIQVETEYRALAQRPGVPR